MSTNTSLGRAEERLARGALLTTGDVAALFSVDVRTVGRWARAGRLTYVRTPGNQMRFRATDIAPLMKENR